VKNLEKLKFW